jgi:hypothetical protein
MKYIAKSVAKIVSLALYGDPNTEIAKAAKLGLWKDGVTEDGTTVSGVESWLNSLTVQVFSSDEERQQVELSAFKAMTQACSEVRNYNCCIEFTRKYGDRVIEYSNKDKATVKELFVDHSVVRYISEALAETRGDGFRDEFASKVTSTFKDAPIHSNKINVLPKGIDKESFAAKIKEKAQEKHGKDDYKGAGKK